MPKTMKTIPSETVEVVYVNEFSVIGPNIYSGAYVFIELCI